MPEYRKGSDKPVAHRQTKYDGFKLVKTEHPYRHQKGSGRSACFGVAKDGMLIGTWTKAVAEKGASDGRFYDSQFVIGSLDKLSGTATPGWTFSDKDDKGRTLAEVKKIRDVDPAKAAARAEKAKAAAEAKAAKKAEADKVKAEKAEAVKAAKARAAADAKAAKAATKVAEKNTAPKKSGAKGAKTAGAQPAA